MYENMGLGAKKNISVSLIAAEPVPLTHYAISAANSDCLTEPSSTSLCGRTISLQGFRLTLDASDIQAELQTAITPCRTPQS